MLILAILIGSGCQLNRQQETTISSDFESGSIGEISKIDAYHWEISLRNDNDDESLPPWWRTWWYIRIDNAPIDAAMKITLKARGWPYYYIPVYSYDGQNWQRLLETEVIQTADNQLIMTKRFEHRRIWMARFYPYTVSKFKSYMDRISTSPRVFSEIIGQSTLKNPIHMLTITDFSVPEHRKNRIWIHARTHPAETGSSFLLEGLIDFLLSESADAHTALSKLVFNIVPMHNIDGIIVGNYRTNTDSMNLEGIWLPDPNSSNPMDLRPDLPSEVLVLNRAIRSFIETDAPFTMALNLHSSNSEPDTAAFFYPHFGPRELGYEANEAALWEDQVSFIKDVASYYQNRIEEIPAEGGRYFASRYYPESWWWRNFKHQVMAITLETVYGRGGYAPKWITPKEIRDLGLAVGYAIMTYHHIPINGARKNRAIEILSRQVNRRFPALYPPAAKDEGKE